MMRGFNSLSGGPGGGGGGEAPDCGTCIKNAWNSVPAWNRAVMIVPIILYLGSFAAPIIAYYTACIPVLVYSKFEGKFTKSLQGFYGPQLTVISFSVETSHRRVVPSAADNASFRPLLICATRSARREEDRHACVLLQILDCLDDNHGPVCGHHWSHWVWRDHASRRTLVDAFCRSCH